ncbi:DUF190 domain-containing protein [Streptomyces sp. NPDC005202]|uniref:DUF190 domain-containing protein n=1 Tax=Streptomyces sp. NPDC005202 TaxID=3157021 RepID=UPI0033BB6CE9
MNPHLPRHHHEENPPPRPPRPPLNAPVLRLTVHLGESDQYHHKPAYTEIVHRAHHAGLSGASVFRGFEGFGTSSIVHTTRLLDLAEDLPVTVVIIDEEDRIHAFLPQAREAAPDALITLEPVQVVAQCSKALGPVTEEQIN